MISTIVAVVLSQFAVSLPRELGHLRLVSSQVTDQGIAIELEYVNVTETSFSSVGIECMVIDHREVVVNDEYKVFTNEGQGFAPGTRVTAKLLVTDHVNRGRRAECAVTHGNRSEAKAASDTEVPRTSSPVVRPIEVPVLVAPDEEVLTAPAPTTKAPATAPSDRANPTTAPTTSATETSTSDGGTTTPVSTPPTSTSGSMTAPAKVETSSPPAEVPQPAPCCKKCGGNTKACGDSCIPLTQKCRTWAGCACTVE